MTELQLRTQAKCSTDVLNTEWISLSTICWHLQEYDCLFCDVYLQKETFSIPLFLSRLIISSHPKLNEVTGIDLQPVLPANVQNQTWHLISVKDTSPHADLRSMFLTLWLRAQLLSWPTTACRDGWTESWERAEREGGWVWADGARGEVDDSACKADVEKKLKCEEKLKEKKIKRDAATQAQ